jgi:5-methylcytosine-specific restriction endonuclease McrA
MAEDSMSAIPKTKPMRLTGKALEDLRRQCFERDGYRCQHIRAFPAMKRGTVYDAKCDKQVTWDGYRTGHMAHIKSRGAGGGDTLDNVITKCAECHIGREHTKGEK